MAASSSPAERKFQALRARVDKQAYALEKLQVALNEQFDRVAVMRAELDVLPNRPDLTLRPRLEPVAEGAAHNGHGNGNGNGHRHGR